MAITYSLPVNFVVIKKHAANPQFDQHTFCFLPIVGLLRLTLAYGSPATSKNHSWA